MLSDGLTALKGVGPALAKKLENLGLHRVEDLLFLLPLRYEDRTQLVRIGALVPGNRVEGPAVIETEATSVVVHPAQTASVDRFGNFELRV